MKRILNKLTGTLLLAAVCCLALTSCGKSSSESPSISVSPAALEFSPAGESKTVTVTSNVKWTCTPSGDFTASPTTGTSGTATVTVTASANSTSGAKTGTVTFTASSASASLSLSQPSTQLSIQPAEVKIGYEAGTVTVELKSNTSWSFNISNKPTWFTSVSPSSGSGNATLTITTAKSTMKTEQAYILTATGGGASSTIVIKKEPVPNSAPTKPQGLNPTGSGVSRTPQFSWSASTDADGDEINYTVLYSKDNSTWTSVAAGTATTCRPQTSLDAGTTYSWKVIADDGFDDGKTESDVVTFTTGSDKNYYLDGEYRVHKTYNNPSDDAVVLVFTGDGYTSDMFEYDNGKFDKDLDRAIEGFFNVEPLISNKHLFRIYKVAAYSNETGISVGQSIDNRTTVKDTKFKCTWKGNGSTGVDIDLDMAEVYWAKVPGLQSDEAQTYSPMCIISNSDVYAGTNHLYWTNRPNGFGGTMFKSVCAVPMCDRGQPMENTVMHEFAGHGFGLLEDEYSYTSQGTISSSDMEFNVGLREKGPLGFGWNVSYVDGIENTPWAPFKDIERYTNSVAKGGEGLGCYLGGATYIGGVWRPTVDGCMNHTLNYHNVQGRWLIYKRIMYTKNGRLPELSEFLANDNFDQSIMTSKSSQMYSPQLIHTDCVRFHVR